MSWNLRRPALLRPNKRLIQSGPQKLVERAGQHQRKSGLGQQVELRAPG